ncbi:MAG: hypothetical protein RID91_12710 [Azospirillaceae bacterium]
MSSRHTPRPRLSVRAVLLAAALAAAPAGPDARAETPAGGPAGSHARVVIVNDGPAPLACRATVAHWFSRDFGTIQPGERRTIPVAADPTTGTVHVFNGRGEALPLEIFYCGPAGEAWQGRASLDLRAALTGGGAVPESVRYRCTASPARADCRIEP